MAGSRVSNASDVKDGGNGLAKAYNFELKMQTPWSSKSRNGQDIQLIHSQKEPSR
jgi:hypothetical protein